jgi:hypothetical protein
MAKILDGLIPEPIKHPATRQLIWTLCEELVYSTEVGQSKFSAYFSTDACTVLLEELNELLNTRATSL